MTEMTRAARRLAKALEEDHGEQTGRNWLAAMLRLTNGAPSRWTTGNARPEAHHRRCIELLFGIPEADWWTADEADLVKEIETFVATTGPEHAQTQSGRKPLTRVPAGSRQESGVGR